MMSFRLRVEVEIAIHHSLKQPGEAEIEGVSWGGPRLVLCETKLLHRRDADAQQCVDTRPDGGGGDLHWTR